MSETLKAERDTLAGLGLLASTYIHFDPPLVGGAAVSHAYGFNVNCLVIDNTDGEAVALERNRIYADCNPLQHAEQLGVRAAIARLHEKRPRDPATSVDAYLANDLFMRSGTAADDFVDKGCTLYNTFDPCGMCATMLLLCKMKRVAYLFADKQYEPVYEQMRAYFKGRDSVKEALSVVAEGDNPLSQGAVVIRRLRERVTRLESKGTPLVMTLDQAECREDIALATSLLIQTHESHLTTTGDDRARNARTLRDIKRLCNIN